MYRFRLFIVVMCTFVSTFVAFGEDKFLSIGVTALYGRGIYTVEEGVPISAIRAYHGDMSADTKSDCRYAGAPGISKALFLNIAVGNFMDFYFGYEKVTRKDHYGETPIVSLAGGGYMFIRGWSGYEGEWYLLKTKFFLPIGLGDLGTICPGLGLGFGAAKDFTVYLKNEDISAYNPTVKNGSVMSFYDGKIKFQGGLALLLTLDAKYVLPKLPITVGAEFAFGIKGNGVDPTNFVAEYQTPMGRFKDDGKATNKTMVSAFKSGLYFYVTYSFCDW